MKTKCPPLVLVAGMMASPANADVYVTDFVALNGAIGAAGAWRNATTNTVFPSTFVSLSQIGGVVKPVDGGSQTSVINNSFQWADIPAIPPIIPFPIDVFNPNYLGDFINVELKGGAVAIVIINFNAFVSDPVLNFTDTDVQTALVFNAPFTVVGKTSNLIATATTVRTSGTNIGPPFDVECAGSLKFSGVHTRLVIGIYNAGTDPDRQDDRTGFSVSTETLPVPLDVLNPTLAIFTTANQILLTWPRGSISSIRQSYNLSAPWNNVATNLETTDHWIADKLNYGSKSYFQGVKPPPTPPP